VESGWLRRKTLSKIILELRSLTFYFPELNALAKYVDEVFPRHDKYIQLLAVPVRTRNDFPHFKQQIFLSIDYP